MDNVVETATNSDGEIIIAENPEKEVTGIFDKINTSLKASPEVQDRAKGVDIKDHNEILAFGSGPANEISTFADKILGIVRKSSIEDSGVMMKELTKLMRTFNPQDFDEKSKGLIGKMFNNAKKAIEKILAKYQTIGGEIDKIYTEISKYKTEISESTNTLEDLFQQNLAYYQALESYIASGQLALEDIKANKLTALEKEVAEGSQLKALELETLKTGIELLEQRIYDLEMGKMVALQTAPQIRMIQKGNFKLMAKIQSAFVITIPIFKTGLIQAITLKRQKLVSDSMKALDDVTNELLLRNAQNAASQSAQIAKMASGSIKMETLENTWKTILDGIDETRAIEEENKKARDAGTKRIHEMQDEMHKKLDQRK
ncbi:MAG: toxic anion resistance protein [Deltaproteobacteria bacterium]|nr:toxic anion resistance protein [Deltaproteobacteria bacterium]